jgi:two-component sensor histidine kinase
MLCLVNLGSQMAILVHQTLGYDPVQGLASGICSNPQLIVSISAVFLFFLCTQNRFFCDFSFLRSQACLSVGNSCIPTQDQKYTKRRRNPYYLAQDVFAGQHDRLIQIARQLECDLGWSIGELRNGNYDLLLQIFPKLKKSINRGISVTRNMMNNLKAAVGSYSECRMINERIAPAGNDSDQVGFVADADAFHKTSIMEYLHDDILPKLACIQIGVQVCAEMLFSDCAEVEAKLMRLHELAKDFEDDVTELRLGKHANSVEVGNLKQAIKDLIENLRECCNVNMHLNVRGSEDGVSNYAKAHLFSVVKESVINLVKHAEPQKARIELDFRSDCAIVSVIDDGKGFLLKSAMAKSDLLGSQGLSRMKNNAQSLGGSLTIDTAPEQGTRVVISVPLQ